MFTRRRHAVAISERCLKLIAWLGAPAMMFFLVHKLLSAGDLGPAVMVSLSVLVAAYLVLVLRLHELTGEWRFL